MKDGGRDTRSEIEQADSLMPTDFFENGIPTKLPAKSVRLVIEALQQYQADHERRIVEDGRAENNISALTNDLQNPGEIKKGFEVIRDKNRAEVFRNGLEEK